MASFLVDASLRALELFQRVEACQAKVFALVWRGRAMSPAAAALEVLLLSEVGADAGNKNLPSGFLEPSGPSEYHWSVLKI